MSQFGDGYVGTAEDGARIRRQNKQRDEQRKKFEEAAKQSQDRIANAGIRQFGASTTEALEHAFKNETIGLVTKAEFMQKRNTLHDRVEEEQRKRRHADEEAAAYEKERRKKERNGAFKPKLSFYEEEQEEDDAAHAEAPTPSGRTNAQTDAPPTTSGPSADGETAAASDVAATATATAAAAATAKATAKAAVPAPAPAVWGSAEAFVEAAAAAAAATAAAADAANAATASVLGARKAGRLGKDPSVRSDFLPDKDRERQEDELRKMLKKEWTTQQEKVKAEPVEITYSYWNGSGHRRKVSVKQGDSISGFLKAARDQLAPDFRELRATSVDNLIFIKEDLIMPHHCTFHELIVSKARGKSGPLFNFTVHEDIRVVNDATVEKGDTHAGKVVERHWYDRNKHIFPANRWEVWDPEKNYENYSIYGE